MSHFSVLVIGDDIEKALAPFQENNCGTCPKEYLQFNDEEAEYLREYNEDSVEQVIMPDGRMLNTWDDTFRVSGSFGFGSNTHKAPDHLEKRMVPFKKKFSTFEEFMKEWCGYSERDPETGKYGYWENPKAKWDWYVIGGRWGGFFRLKPGAFGIKGEESAFGPTENLLREGYADQVYKKDIDFDFMRNMAALEAEKNYNDVLEIFDGEIPKIEQWKNMLKQPDFNQNNQAYRDHYNSQLAVEEFRKARQGFYDSLDDFQCTKEEYIQQARDNALSTFAVLMNGQWYEKGAMGWWGIVSNEKEQADWNKKFNELLDSLPDDILLTAVDCHI